MYVRHFAGVCVRACVRACVCACVRARARARVCVCVCVYKSVSINCHHRSISRKRKRKWVCNKEYSSPVIQCIYSRSMYRFIYYVSRLQTSTTFHRTSTSTDPVLPIQFSAKRKIYPRLTELFATQSCIIRSLAMLLWSQGKE